MVGLLGLVFTFWIASDGHHYREESTYIIFLLGLFISGTIFASMSFNMLGQKDKGIYWLSLPATHFEKLLCTLFYTVILFFAAYCLCFYITKLLSVAFIHKLMADDPSVTYTEMKDMSKGFGEVLPYFIYGFFAVQALYLLGSVYFSRFSFVVTSVVGCILFFAFGLYINELREGFFNKELWWDFTIARLAAEAQKDSYKLYSVSQTTIDALTYVVQFAWAPIFWVVTWYRLKEKEI